MCWQQSGVTSQWVEDASFIRLKTITLAYSFEQKLLKKIGFTKARIYVSGTNLVYNHQLYRLRS